MANTAVYSSIDELDISSRKRPGGVLTNQTSDLDRQQFGSTVAPPLPPPLPPPNPKPPLSALMEAKSKSDESMCQVDANMRTGGDVQLSNSSQKNSSSDLTEGINAALYATVNKQKAPEVPPPIPPPLSPSQIPKETEKCEVTTNGYGPDSEGVLFLPSEDQKLRKPAIYPRSHVYETVPDDIVQTQQQQQEQQQQQQPRSRISTGGGTFRRKSSKKRKSIKSEKEQVSMLAVLSPLEGAAALSKLEPLPSSGETMKLNEFVKRFCHYLPLCVRVDEGYCGTEERFVISSGDIYNFHFVKNEKVVSLRDSGGNSFSVPLNSAIEFGLLYNPNGDFDAAMRGYTFKTVSELAGAKSCPKILCATQAHVSNDSKSSVQVDEILIVKKMSKTHVMKKRVLKVFSLTTKEYKTLQDDCEGHFTTTPQQVKLYLPEIIEHFGSSFPLEAMLYMRPDSTEELPLHLTSDLVTLTQTATETSIIASTCWEDHKLEELSEEDRALVAIPINLDIEVTFLGRESDNRLLDEATRTLFERFSSLKITDMKNGGGMQMGVVSNSAQKKLYNAVRQDCLSNGTEIQLPIRLSAVYEAEGSPLHKKTSDPENHVYYTLLPEGVEASPTNSLSNSASTNESKNECPSVPVDIRTQPCALPPHKSSSPSRHNYPCPLPLDPPSSPTRRSMSLSSTTNTSTSSSNSGVGMAINTELHEAYSAIEELFNSTLSGLNISEDSIAESKIEDVVEKYDYIATDNNRHCNLRPPEQEDDISTVLMRQRKKESASDALVPEESPKASPKMSSPNFSRSKSKSVFMSESRLSYERRGRSSSSGELGSSWRKNGNWEERNKIMDFEELSMSYATLQREVQELRKELREAREMQDYATSQQMQGETRKPRPKSEMKASSEREQEMNIEDLKALDHNEVLHLLDAMNLSQYKEKFMQEQVDGELLAECDEAMLKDLDITSAIHRNRLMKIINGKHSASYFTSNSDKLYSTLNRPCRN